MPVAAEYFIGTVDGELACHLAVAPFFQSGYYRATRLVTMPEWQGAGVGTKFLNWVGEYHKRGFGRKGKKFPMIIHTSHPQLAGYLRHSPKWVLRTKKFNGGGQGKGLGLPDGVLGAHFRAIFGFKYIGDGNKPKPQKGFLID